MASFVHDPYSSEEVESRFQELRAQQVRAQQLFHGSSIYLGDPELDEDGDDPYLADYDEAAGEDRS